MNALLTVSEVMALPAGTAPWVREATEYLGTAEIPGAESNPAIMQWAKRQAAWIAAYYTNDDIPWCALFVNECLRASSIRGTGSLAARSFLKWGGTLEEPVFGCVLVFKRAGGGTSGGHVGFYVGETATHYRVRSGNQSNKVCDAWIAKERLLKNGIRWPVDGWHKYLPAARDIGRIWLANDGTPASVNEG